MQRNYTRNTNNGVHFLTKLQAEDLQLYQKCIPSQIFFKIFPQIFCYLSKFRDVLGKLISQKNLLLAAANVFKVFKIFIPTKNIQSVDQGLRKPKTFSISSEGLVVLK